MFFLKFASFDLLEIYKNYDDKIKIKENFEDLKRNLTLAVKDLNDDKKIEEFESDEAQKESLTGGKQDLELCLKCNKLKSKYTL